MPHPIRNVLGNFRNYSLHVGLVMQYEFPLFRSRLDDRFEEFHEKNPHVYAKLVELSHDLKDVGHNTIGMKMLFEIIRWKTMLQTTDGDFKMNNSYASRYVRLIEQNEPELVGMFSKRGLRS